MLKIVYKLTRPSLPKKDVKKTLLFLLESTLGEIDRAWTKLQGAKM